MFDGNGTGQDQRLQSGAGQFCDARGQHAVEPGRSLVALDYDFHRLPALRRHARFP